MELWTSLAHYLPPPIARALDAVEASSRRAVQELRLRAGQPMRLSTATEDIVLDAVTDERCVEECFFRFCGQAVHTHAHELREGFIATPEGFRVGIGGTAVMRDGKIHTYRAVTSLCVRIPRFIAGSAAALMPFLTDGTGGLLLCGAPAAGKTTVLRDAAYRLSQTRRVTVVDERSELAVSRLSGCDVLRGCPKAVGILQAVRGLSPDWIVADELGDEEEWRAVAYSAHCGVPLLCTAHIGNEDEARQRPTVMSWLERRAVATVVFLPPRHRPFENSRIWKVEDFLENRRDRMLGVCLRGGGDRGGVPSAESASVVGSLGDAVATVVSRPAVFGDAGAMAAEHRGSRRSGSVDVAVGV